MVMMLLMVMMVIVMLMLMEVLMLMVVLMLMMLMVMIYDDGGDDFFWWQNVPSASHIHPRSSLVAPRRIHQHFHPPSRDLGADRASHTIEPTGSRGFSLKAEMRTKCILKLHLHLRY